MLMEIIEKENVEMLIEEEKLKERLNSITLKFIFNEKTYFIHIKRTNTLKELKLKLLEELNMSTIKHSNVRLILLQKDCKTVIQVFNDEDRTLEETNIHPNRTYSIETKTDSEIFEEFNSDIIVLNVFRWKDEYLDPKIEEKDFLMEKVKIDKNESIEKLIKLLLENEFKNSEQHKLVWKLYKKIDYASNSYQMVKLYPFENNIEERLKLVNHLVGCKIYLEYDELQNNSNICITNSISNIESKFGKFFDESSGNVIIKFNFPIKPVANKKISFNSYKFDNQLEIKKSKTLAYLKSHLSSIINVPENNFIMKRNSHNGMELKNLVEILEKYTTSQMSVYLEYGQPKKDSEIKINIFLCEYDFTFFLVFPYKISDKGSFTVDLSWNIKQLKEIIAKELNLKDVLIRDYKNERPGKIYKEESFLGKDLQFLEGKKIILQEDVKMTEYQPDDICVTIREWNPSEWKISRPVEFHFSKGLTFLELAYKLHLLFPHLEADKISAYKIHNELNIFMDDFVKFKVNCCINIC
jgi:hypothetical protein